MTEEEINAAHALVSACTGSGDAEWWLNENDGGICCGPDGSEALEVGYTDMNEADTALVLAAPVLIKKLLAELRARAGAEQATMEAIATWLENGPDITTADTMLHVARHIRDGTWRKP
jgi:hypothetical protein